MFTGSIVALITPMDQEGKLDRMGLKKLIDYHIESGTSAIVSVGTTGESATLNHDEHANVVMTTLELAAGKIPVIAGTGANSTSEAIGLTKRFNNTAVAGCLSVTPYYNKPTQEGLFQHYKKIAESTDLPQILYNVPSRTGCDLLPETVARLAEISNIIALKDATGDLSRVRRTRMLVDKRFLLFSGDDSTGLDFMQLGGQGVISVTANVAAKEIAMWCNEALTGNFDTARKIDQNLLSLHKYLFIESNPAPVKWACRRLGLIKNDALRLPLVPLSASAQPIVEQALRQANLLS